MSRRGRGLFVVALLGVAALVVVWWGVPQALRGVAISQLSQATGLTTSLDSLTLNPFTGRVSVTGLTLTDRGRSEPLLHIPQMDARVRVWPLLTRHIHVVEATLVAPQIHAIRTEGKDFDVANFLTPFYVGEVFNRNGYTLTVDKADVRQGSVIIDDRGSTPPQIWIAREVNVEAQELLSAPLGEASWSETERPASGTVTATFQLQDASATLRGVNIRLVPAQGTLTATFQDFSLPLLGPYFGVGHTGSSDHPVLGSGTLKADLRLRYGPDQAPTLDGVVIMDQVAVRHPGQRDPYLTAPQLTLAVEELRGGTAAFTVSRVKLTGAPTWIDARVSPPIKLRLKTATLEAESIAWPTKDPTWMRFLAYLPEGGKLKAQGPVAWDPFEADLRIALRHADLGRYQRFLPITAPVPLSGRADADFRLVARGGDRVTASGRGEFSVRGLEVGPADARILLAERADAIAVDIAWPGRIAVRCLRFLKPSAILEREEDGTFPMRDLLATTKPVAPTSRRPHATPALRPTIGAVVVQDGYVRFVDRSLTPNYTQELSHLALKVKGLARPRSRVQLQGVIGGGGALELEGEVAGLTGRHRYLDLRGELREFAVPTANPYVSRMLAWFARRGALYTKVHYRIEGDRITATHQLVFDHLEVEEVGEHDVVKQRIGLPLGLLVSLLKNAHGEIHLDLPVTGTLSEPQFNFAEALWDATKRAVLNVLAAPFRAIGRLATSEDKIEELAIDPLPFEPGSAVLSPAAREQVAHLQEFLRNAPFVQLTVSPIVTSADLVTLQTQNVTAEIQRLQRSLFVDFPEATRRLFVRRFPGHPVPERIEDMLEAIREQETVSEEAARRLAARRLDTVRQILVGSDGIGPDRLQPLELPGSLGAPGPGRVEFAVAQNPRP